MAKAGQYEWCEQILISLLIYMEYNGIAILSQ